MNQLIKNTTTIKGNKVILSTLLAITTFLGINHSTVNAQSVETTPSSNFQSTSISNTVKETANTLSSESLINSIEDEAIKYLGVHYKWGGDIPTEGFDGSGFVQYVFGTHNIKLPRTALKQSEKTTEIKKEEAQKGDVLFFSFKKDGENRRVQHSAIYLGNEKFIHVTNRGVTIDSFENPKWDEYFMQVNRVITEEDVQAFEQFNFQSTESLEIANAIEEEARNYLGTPYQWGGNKPETGFDASGFVQYVYGTQGIKLPRISREQYKVAGEKLMTTTNVLQKGDLVFFSAKEDRKYITHVGIYIGEGSFINVNAKGVKIDSLESWSKFYVGAKRVITTKEQETKETSNNQVEASNSTEFQAFSSTTSNSQKQTTLPLATALEKEGRKYLGLDYVWGGKTQAGFDCSGFIQYIFAKNRIDLPRTSSKQYLVGNEVEKTNLQKGDLVFFNTSGTDKVSHVGMYLNNGRFINANKDGVVISNLKEKRWATSYVGAKRIFTEDETGIFYGVKVEKVGPGVVVSEQTTFSLNEDHITYTVQKGNTIIEIASHFGVNITDIMRWNKLSSTKLIEGQKLIVVNNNID